jgi:hypothetical protein
MHVAWRCACGGGNELCSGEYVRMELSCMCAFGVGSMCKFFWSMRSAQLRNGVSVYRVCPRDPRG